MDVSQSAIERRTGEPIVIVKDVPTAKIEQATHAGVLATRNP